MSSYIATLELPPQFSFKLAQPHCPSSLWISGISRKDSEYEILGPRFGLGKEQDWAVSCGA